MKWLKGRNKFRTEKDVNFLLERRQPKTNIPNSTPSVSFIGGKRAKNLWYNV